MIFLGFSMIFNVFSLIFIEFSLIFIDFSWFPRGGVQKRLLTQADLSYENFCIDTCKLAGDMYKGVCVCVYMSPSLSG